MEPVLAEKIVHGLKAVGIDFITYLPESRLSQILPLLREDGTVQMVASPIDFSETNWAPQGPAPQLGAHTELILSGELGYDWETITALKDQGIIL